MKFAIVLDGEPQVDLLSWLSEMLSRINSEAHVYGLPEAKVIELEPGDVLVRVKMPGDLARHSAPSRM